LTNSKNGVIPPEGGVVKPLEWCFYVIAENVVPIHIGIVGVWQGRLYIFKVKVKPLRGGGLDSGWDSGGV